MIGTYGYGARYISLIGGHRNPNVAGGFVSAVTGASAGGIAAAIQRIVDGDPSGSSVGTVFVGYGDSGSFIVAKW